MKIYEPIRKAREYSPLALNIFNGCDHGCSYCYVPNLMKRFRSEYNHCDLSIQSFDGLEASVKKLSGSDFPVLLSFTGDPYCQFNDKVKATRKVLEILLKHDIKVSILTKGGERCFQDIDLFKKFGDRIRIGATLTLDNQEDSKMWEPGAASPSERLLTLKALHNEGIKTWASFEPVLSTRQSLNLMYAGFDFIDLYKVGKLNNYKGLDKKIDWKSFLRETVRILRLNAMRFYIKEDLKIQDPDFVFYPDEIDPDYYNDFTK